MIEKWLREERDKEHKWIEEFRMDLTRKKPCISKRPSRITTQSNLAGKANTTLELIWSGTMKSKVSKPPSTVTSRRCFSNFNTKCQGNNTLTHNISQYGTKQQLTRIDTSVPMSKAQKNLLMEMAGKFLYYDRSIDNTMMHALNNLITTVNDKQSPPTFSTTVPATRTPQPPSFLSSKQ